MLDLCEDPAVDIRKQAIKDLPTLCRDNKANLPKITDVLTQVRIVLRIRFRIRIRPEVSFGSGSESRSKSETGQNLIFKLYIKGCLPSAP
jgi:hypothetical protein